MNDLEKRIEKLEKRAGVNKRQAIITACYDDDNTEPTDVQMEAAIADFKLKNPNWEEGDLIVLFWNYGQFEPAHTMISHR